MKDKTKRPAAIKLTPRFLQCSAVLVGWFGNRALGSASGRVSFKCRHLNDYALWMLSHGSTQGLAAAFAFGLDAALQLGADVMMDLDADGQDPASEVRKLVRPIIVGSADIMFLHGAGKP